MPRDNRRFLCNPHSFSCAICCSHEEVEGGRGIAGAKATNLLLHKHATPTFLHLFFRVLLTHLQRIKPI